MKISSAKKNLIIYVLNHFLTGVRFFEIKRRLLNFVGYEIGEGTKIVGPIYNTGVLKIGKMCWIGRDLKIHGNGTVIIKDNCDIAPDVTFLTGGHKIGETNRRAGEGESYTITVGNGAWIGAGTTILGNTQIGTGCVVAACACVTKDVPCDSLVGGVPAKIIRGLKNESKEFA